MSETLILDEDFTNLNAWTYNPTYWWISAGVLQAIGGFIGGPCTMYPDGIGIIQQEWYRVEWKLTFWVGQGAGMFWLAESTAGTWNFTGNEGVGTHSRILQAGTGGSEFRLQVGGPSGWCVYRMDWLKVYHLTGKPNLVNNRPIQNLVNKGL